MINQARLESQSVEPKKEIDLHRLIYLISNELVKYYFICRIKLPTETSYMELIVMNETHTRKYRICFMEEEITLYEIESVTDTSGTFVCWIDYNGNISTCV